MNFVRCILCAKLFKVDQARFLKLSVVHMYYKGFKAFEYCVSITLLQNLTMLSIPIEKIYNIKNSRPQHI